MRNAARFTGLLLALLLGLLCGCGGENGVEGSATDPLPPDDFLDRWKKTAPARVYRSADLYGHINGGAEVFLELGFDRLTVQHYSSGLDKVSVELYRMKDAAAALGIYLMKCGEETPDPSFDVRHTKNRHQLFLLRGSAFVIFGNRSETDGAAAALLDFARETAEGIEAIDTSRIFDVLPDENRLPGTERVIRGPFTLQRLFTLGKGDILLLRGTVTAAASDYADGSDGSFTRIVAPYPDSRAAREAFEHVVANIDPYIELLTSDHSLLIFKDYSGRFGSVRIKGSQMEVIVNLAEKP